MSFGFGFLRRVFSVPPEPFAGLVNPGFNEGPAGNFPNGTFGWDEVSDPDSRGEINNNGTTIHVLAVSSAFSATSVVYQNTSDVPGNRVYQVKINSKETNGIGNEIGYGIWTGSTLIATGSVMIDDSGVYKDYTGTINLSGLPGGKLRINVEIQGFGELSQTDTVTLDEI